MGHIRLGRLPRTKRWSEVVELIGGSASSAAVASAVRTISSTRSQPSSQSATVGARCEPRYPAYGCLPAPRHVHARTIGC